MHAKSLQSCPTLCDPTNCSLPGPSVQGILQARILQCEAMPFSGEGENSDPFNNKGHSRYLCPTFSAWNVWDLGSIPGLGRSTGEGIGYPLLYSWTSLVSQLVKNPSNNVGDLGLILGLGRSPGKGKGYPLQHSGLENSMDCIVHGVAKSRTWLNNFHFHFLPEILIPLLVYYSLPNCLPLFAIQYILFICNFSKLAISFWWKNINSWRAGIVVYLFINISL